MATTNPFNILLDDDHEDPTQLVAAQQPKVAPVKKAAASPALVSSQSAKPAKLPSNPLPPAEAVRDAKTEPGQGSGRGGGLGRSFGRGVSRGGFSRDSESNENHFRKSSGFSGVSRPAEYGDSEKASERRGSGGPWGSLCGGRRGGLSNGEAGDGERPRRIYERHSGTGRGNEYKRDGAGRGNWGSPINDIAPEAGEPVVENEKSTGADKQEVDDETVDVSKENPVNEPEEKEPEDKEMTLEEYEKVLEEKRQVLMSLKMEERKVDADKEFGSMQQLSSKKGNDDIFIKLGSEKDKRKDLSDKEDKVKKPVDVNFLKPAEVERYYSSTGRGRGQGRTTRAGFGGSAPTNRQAPSIEDPGQFPSLGAK